MILFLAFLLKFIKKETEQKCMYIFNKFSNSRFPPSANKSGEFSIIETHAKLKYYSRIIFGTI